jgi:hypothetical protein
MVKFVIRLAVVSGLAVAGGPALADGPWRLGDPLRLSPDAEAAPGTSLSFTPRQDGVFGLDQARLELSLAPAPSLTGRDGGFAVNAETSRFAVGGALDFGAVELSGRLVGERGDDVAREGVDAALGLGSVTTRMSYMAESGERATTRYGLGADLAAAPGVSVGAGLALEDDAADGAGERATEGVVRFRLQF